MVAKPSPLILPEIVGLVIENVHKLRDLVNCACVNGVWYVTSLKKLYRGSLNDLRLRTPDIGSLNSLLVASRARFAQNMGFVDHLLLSPEKPAIYYDLAPGTRKACFEKCRALRHRQYAELLLRPHGKGLASLTIPFEIVVQDFSMISDLLLTPTIEYLAVDSSYCRLVGSSFNYTQEPMTLAAKFSKLKALTIYKSNGEEEETDEICQLLDCCDLQFFHLEEGFLADDGNEDERIKMTETLLHVLRKHHSLTTLALATRNNSVLSRSVAMMMAREDKQESWPNLKALYLQDGNQYWLQRLPNFKELQILKLRFAPGTSTIPQGVIEEIAKFQHLRVIQLEFDELNDVEVLSAIAQGCPLLLKLSVSFSGEHEKGQDVFLRLLRALPLLEFLELGLKFQMDGSILQELARRCPRLIVLKLLRTRLCLSLVHMKILHPLPHLEVMCVQGVCFENPRCLMQRRKIERFATEWRRIFPKLLDMPCLADRFSQYMVRDDLSEGSGEITSECSDEEISPMELGPDVDDYKSDWLILRAILWKTLGYGKDPDCHERIPYMWQSNLEIETIGWPVVPLGAFSDPDRHSTTAD